MEVISHWHPNITINIVDDHTPWVKGSVPPPLDQCRPPAPGLLTKPRPCLLGLLGSPPDWVFISQAPRPVPPLLDTPFLPRIPPVTPALTTQYAKTGLRTRLPQPTVCFQKMCISC